MENIFMPTEIFNVEGSPVMAAMETVSDSADVFDEDTEDTTLPVPGTNMRYVIWGSDDLLPYHILEMVGSDEVMSQNKLFNVLTCYGAGLKYRDLATGQPSRVPEIRKWVTHNAIPTFFLEQATDMKYYFFAVSVIILSRDGSKITSLRHKDACYCRFEKADKGKIKHVFYGNFRKHYVTELEQIRLLDERDPLGELNILMGREPGPDGSTYMRTRERKFAILVKFPTPGNRYYPIPNYTAIFRGDWFDIKRLIGKGKKAKLRNHASVKYQVEIHKDFWANLMAEEHITDPLRQKERIKQEKTNIKNFVAGIENSGKVWITGYYLDPNGKENRMVRINVIDSSKEGGDWSEDIQEAANITCYGDNIHPNLVGATPGKSTNNNSGSDKRELFTLKQAIEVSFHDLMATPHNVVIEYNGWADKVVPDVEMILLTTLDQHTDAKKISSNSNVQLDD
jgi:hypothetical protein